MINTWEFFIEFTILIIHPIPFYEMYFDIEIIDMLETKTMRRPVRYLLCYDFLFAFMCMRVYFLVRTLMNFSIFAELYSRKVCVQHGFEYNTSFCLRAMYKKQTGTIIIMVSLISIMWLAYVLRIFER